MKRGLLGVIVFASLCAPAFSFADYWVSPHVTSKGTYVSGHFQSNPDGNPYNNYSFPGNTNPYTGVTAGGNTSTYLNNYYGFSGSAYSGGSYTSPYYTTPSCPLMATYDSLTDSCKCMSGYVVSGSSCVSGNSVCWAKMGYGSSYDRFSKTCSCDYGYILDSSGQCTYASLYCSAKIGLMSSYNSVTKSCECMSGYVYNGSSCIYKAATSKVSLSSTYTYTPAYSNVATVVPALSSLSNDQYCQNSYGSGSKWDGTKTPEGKIICTCSKGNTWNSTRTACVVNYYTGGTNANITATIEPMTGQDYYIKNHTCVGLSDNQYSDCLQYAYNH
jgi:hypothetical protein